VARLADPDPAWSSSRTTVQGRGSRQASQWSWPRFRPFAHYLPTKEAHRTRSKTTAAAAAVLLAGSLFACNDNPTGPSVTADQQRDLNALFGATNAYTDFSRAQADGYTERLTDCMADSSGGMGYHYGKVANIDGNARLLEPEILMYEPQPDGSLKFVGIEFVVPLSAAATPPSLFGIPFHRNEAFQLWVLHVWLYRENPSGMFTDWNPTVSCAAAR